jgi:hypothetical protein
MDFARLVCSMAVPVNPTGKNTFVSTSAHARCVRQDKLFQVASAIDAVGAAAVGGFAFSVGLDGEGPTGFAVCGSAASEREVGFSEDRVSSDDIPLL